MLDRFTTPLRRSLELARTEMPSLGAEQLLLGVLREGSSHLLSELKRQGVASRDLEQHLAGCALAPTKTPSTVAFTPSGRRALGASEAEATALEQRMIGVDHAALGALKALEPPALSALQALGIDTQRLEQALRDTVMLHANRTSGRS